MLLEFGFSHLELEFWVMALYPKLRFLLMGDRGLLLEFGDEISPEVNRKVKRMAAAVQGAGIGGIIEQVPTYRSLLVLYDPRIIPLEHLKGKLERIEDHLGESAFPEPRLTRIPVVYGETYGPDFDFVMQYHQLSREEVIGLHCSRPYLVYMIGFMPGFPYMGELPEKLVTPRLKTPRLSVPAGSVAIAQKQTGIYPVESPGGWQIIGRTPVKLFDPEQNPPTLLQIGDRVEFYPIHEREFREWRP